MMVFPARVCNTDNLTNDDDRGSRAPCRSRVRVT